MNSLHCATVIQVGRRASLSNLTTPQIPSHPGTLSPFHYYLIKTPHPQLGATVLHLYLLVSFRNVRCSPRLCCLFLQIPLTLLREVKVTCNGGTVTFTTTTRPLPLSLFQFYPNSLSFHCLLLCFYWPDTFSLHVFQLFECKWRVSILILILMEKKRQIHEGLSWNVQLFDVWMYQKKLVTKSFWQKMAKMAFVVLMECQKRHANDLFSHHGEALAITLHQ